MLLGNSSWFTEGEKYANDLQCKLEVFFSFYVRCLQRYIGIMYNNIYLLVTKVILITR